MATVQIRLSQPLKSLATKVKRIAQNFDSFSRKRLLKKNTSIVYRRKNFCQRSLHADLWHKDSILCMEENANARPKEERPQPRLINDMMRKLYINKKYKKDFDTMTTNPLPSSKEWVPVEKELREWLKALCTTNEGKQRLALMPIPLCVCEVTGLIYTQMWYKMERQMIEDLRYYLPGVPVEFPAESCPVCFETFKVEGNDDNGDSDEDSVVGRVMDCGHKICEACFNQCKSEPGGASGTMRQKCPICRTKTYLRELFDRNMFEAWYNKRTGGKGKLTAKQMEPLYAMVGSPGYFLLQGGPGVGKSETAGMFTEWESEMRQKHPHAAQAVGRSVFVAPTGAAAKNVGDRLDRDKFQVNTVHTWLLSLHKRRRERREMHRTGHFSGDVELPVPFLFVDEAGMLGLWMTSLVLREARTSGIERIMFIGDRFQLPPVGTIGSLFASCCLTESKRIKSRVFSLTENFRSDVKGINDMLKNIKNVMQNIENGALNHGDGSAVMGLREECFQGKAGDKSIDLIKIKGNAEKSQEQILDGVLKVLCELEEEEEDTKALSSKKGGLLSDTTCVISSKRKRSYLLDRKWLQGADETAAGKYLKILHMMNGNRNKPTPRKKKSDPTCKRDIGKFVKGDRVMCLENISVDGDNANPRKLVLSNGSQGHVVSVTYNDYNRIKSMVVKFDGQEISYPISEWYTKSEYYVKPTDTNGTAADEKGAGSNGNGDGHRRRGTKRKRTIDDVNAYNESQFSKLFPDGVELASVQTVHKYQGSQQDNVVVVMYNAGGDGSTPDTHNTLNLLYTAASRAKKRVRFVMDEKTLKHFWEKPTIAKQDVQLIELLDAIK